MRKIKRALHVDFHTMPGIEDFLENFSAADFAKTLSDSHISYVNVFARCNIGFSYYPTKIGTPYPYMKSDMLGDIIKACHERDIEVSAYLNGGVNHELLVKRPEFMKMNKDGSVYSGDRVLNNFFRTPCFNTGYRQHLLAEIAEILKKEPDGIFCDCLIPKSCYCPECMSQMKEKGIDTSDECQVFKFAVDTLTEVFGEIRAAVPSSKRLYLNSFPYEGVHNFSSHAELECLPTDSGIWGYDYISAQAPYFRKFTDETVYMTGRFVTSWGDFGGSKTLASLENDVYDALLYGYAPSVGDHMHPRDGLSKSFYSNIAKTYGFVKELEEWTDSASPITEAAIIRNKLSIGEAEIISITPSDQGAARMLCELKICYDVINEDMDFAPYKLLILPDNINITDNLKKKLEAFGGSILSTGKSISHGSVWDYISEFEYDKNTDGFYSYKGEIYGQYCMGVKMKSDHTVSDYIEPYFQKKFDGAHGYFYVPPKDCNGFAAVAVSGSHAHIGFNIFEAYLTYGAVFHKQLVSDLIGSLLPERLIEPSGLPASLRATLMSADLGDILHIKTTFPEHRGERGIIEEHITMPAGAKISVLGEYKNVFALPDMTEIKCSIQSERTKITLPEIIGYKAFLLKRK